MRGHFRLIWILFLASSVGAPTATGHGDRAEPPQDSPQTHRAHPAQAGPTPPAPVQTNCSPAANPAGYAPEQLTGCEGGVGGEQGIATRDPRGTGFPLPTPHNTMHQQRPTSGAEEHDIPDAQLRGRHRLDMQRVSVADERPHAPAMRAKNNPLLPVENLHRQFVKCRMIQATGFRRIRCLRQVIHRAPKLTARHGRCHPRSRVWV